MGGTAQAPMNNPVLSLSDLLGKPYTDAVCDARAFVEGVDKAALEAIADEKVELCPASYQNRVDDLIDVVGQKVCAGLAGSARGAGTTAFNKITDTARAPLTGLGFIRIGEDGKAYLTTKSEHYHLSVGHSFPGYRLVENGKRLGIPQATHNNTRGHITRLVEQELVRVANGIAKGDAKGLQRALDSTAPHMLNRVLNLETGSLVVEAGLKMMLARFFRIEETSPSPVYEGRIPVLLVMADNAGGKGANYHGTTTLTQVMRGMWPELGGALETGRALVVRPVRINDGEHFRKTLEEYDTAPYKVAGFFHEIIMMNYGAIRLDEEYLRHAYELCWEHDVPVLADEIQSCIWYPEFFLFREYGLQPDLVAVGKGFPGGEYPAARILASAPLDSLHQFGALVTNGQEELASLAYLVTMAFAEANSAHTRQVGEHYEAELKAMARRYPQHIERIEGQAHLSSIFFHSVDTAQGFIMRLNHDGIDISVQSYKAAVPPAALTKLPVISTARMVDFLIARMRAALDQL